MGWIAIVVAPQWLLLLPTMIIQLIIGGGIVYSVGALIFSLKRPNPHRHLGFHELWHLFVMGGVGLHFAAIAFLIS